MPENIQAVIAIIGAIAFFAGLFGGFKAKDIEVSSLPFTLRVISFIVGILFIGIAVWPFVRDQVLVSPTPTVLTVLPINTSVPSTSTPVKEATSPTSTNTPVPTKTQRPLPTPTATIDADPTVYDNFNNPAFNGNINSGLWSIDHRGNAGTAKIIQQDGMLLISDTSNSTSDGIILKLRNWDESRFEFFEIKVMFSSEGEGNGNISINAESPDIPAGWTELGIGHHPSHNYASVGTKMNDQWVGGPDLQYNMWYKGNPKK